MDSGANINIFTDELENGLTNARQSRISVGGFTGASVRASKDGTAHMSCDRTCVTFSPIHITNGVYTAHNCVLTVHAVAVSQIPTK